MNYMKSGLVSLFFYKRILSVLIALFLCLLAVFASAEQVFGDAEGNRERSLEEARRVAEEIEAEYGIEVLLLEECDEVEIGEPFSFSHEVHSGSPLQEMLGCFRVIKFN